MKFTFLALALSLGFIAACRPGVTNPKTKEFTLKASDVPSGLPLPTLDWEFGGNKFSDKADLVEEHTSATGQRFVVYGFATSINNPTAHADLALYFKGRSGGKDRWVVRWDVDGGTGEKEFVYVSGTEQGLIDTDKLKVRVK
jgi:hypothetical protein